MPPARRTLLGELVIFDGIQHGGSIHPRVDRIGCDDVELLLGRCDEMPRIVVDHLDARVVEDVVVRRREVLARGLRDEWLDLADDNALDFRMDDQRSRGHARTETDHESGLGIRMEDRRKVSQHALESHVVANRSTPSPCRRREYCACRCSGSR